ncbi:MAG: glycosyltransferase [Vicinamibacterales bacterium]
MTQLPLLSVLIPCFNEAATLDTIVARVLDVPLDLRKELITSTMGRQMGASCKLWLRTG